VAAALAILAVGAAAPAAAHAAGGTVTVHITGAGKVSGGDIDCTQDGGTCSAEVPETCITLPKPHCFTGFITLAAVDLPGTGFSFDHWSGCTSVEGRNCTVAGDINRSVTAVFVDTHWPEVTLTAPGTGVHRGTIALRADASDNVRVQKVVFTAGRDSVATDTSAPYTATFDTHRAGDGALAIQATAYDTAGHTTSQSRTITVDNTPPSLNVAGPDGQTFGPGSTQRWTIDATDSSGLASVRCRVAPADAVDCSDGMTVSAMPEGQYSLEVVATDKAGNTRSLSRPFAIDATPPETTISSGLADGATTTATALEWGFESSEPGSTFECRIYPAALTPGALAPCSGSGAHAASGFAPGVYAFEVVATDAVGNVDPTPAKRTFTVAAPQESPAPPASPAPPTPPVLLPAPSPISATPAEAKPQIFVSLVFGFHSNRRTTRLTRLVVKRVPKGSTVKARCKRGCARKTYTKRHARGTVSLKKLVRHKRIRVGTKITVTVSKRGMRSMTKVLKIRKRRAPSVRTLTSRSRTSITPKTGDTLNG
jgi:hypothetical protein